MSKTSFFQKQVSWIGQVIAWLSFLYLSTVQAAALYDPQPPANSAYVRVLVVSATGSINVLVDGKPRLANVAIGEPSDYMVLPAGMHKVTLRSHDKAATVEIPIDAIAGRASTIALIDLHAHTKPMLFEDKTNGNKLKAILAVYNLASNLGMVDVLSADGATRVFAKVAPGSTAALAVNPLTIDLIIAKPDDKTALSTASLAMSQGGGYSIVITASESGKGTMKAFTNKVERYTGK